MEMKGLGVFVDCRMAVTTDLKLGRRNVESSVVLE